MMNNRLSHSSCSKFQECPQAWVYHYKDKLRPRFQSAALLFGSALDHSITSMLKNKDKDPKEIFSYFWRFQDINGVSTYLTNSTDIVYANADFDIDLLEDEDITSINTKYQIEDLKTVIDNLYEEKEEKGFNNLSKDKKELLNVLNWHCLYRKGLLMLQTIQSDILPNIEEVLGVQVQVKLTNGSGDVIIGYADLVCKYKGYDSPIIFDWKTSSREYQKDSVLTSPQLTLYVYDLGDQFNTRKAGFIVLNKHIRKNKTKICVVCNNDGSGKRHKTCDVEINGKRCNGEWKVKIDKEVYKQIIVDDIPQQTENIVIQNYDYINQSIKNGIFHRNFSSCVKPYGKCPYYNLCYFNNLEDLTKLVITDGSN